MAAQEYGDGQGRWQDYVNLALGVWLIVAPWIGVGVHNDLAAWNSYIAGLVVAIFSIAAIARAQLWEEWLNLVIGLWLILAPFVLYFTAQPGPTWNHIIVGVVIAIDAAWAAVRLQALHRTA